LVLAMVVCTLLGIVIEKLAYKPLRAAPSLAVLITAIGSATSLQNAALLLWSSNPKVFPDFFSRVDASGDGQRLHDLRRPAPRLLRDGRDDRRVRRYHCGARDLHRPDQDSARRCAPARRTRRGAAQGINVNTTISVTFAIGSGLARSRACCCAPRTRR
jgi:branched-chain amino acid transport system permease protein